MARQAEDAITDANSALVTFGYYTPVIVLRGESPKRVLEQARLVASEVRRDGFSARIESVNALEAWLGSLPGHIAPNVRRPLIHSLNLADLLPLSSLWPGLAANPSPLFPQDSPPLLFGAAAGATPFRLNLHVSDVGHTLIFGPTGAGKSTLLAIIAAQFLRYPSAKVTTFDKGRSSWPWPMAWAAAITILAASAASAWRRSPPLKPNATLPLRETGSRPPIRCKRARRQTRARSTKSTAR